MSSGTSKGMEVMAKEDEAATDLVALIDAGDEAGLRRALMAGADPNADHPGGQTALETAVLVGQPGLVRLLAAYGADVDRTDGYGETALHFAAQRDETGCVAALLDCGADPFLANDGGMTALSFAAERCSERSTRLLLDAQTRIDRQRSDREARLPGMFAEDDELDLDPEVLAERTVFQIFKSDAPEDRRQAAWRCAVMIATYQMGRVNWPVEIGEAEMMLMYNVVHGSLEEVDAWLPRVSTVNVIDHGVGWSLLVSAVDRNSLELVERLLAAGADPTWAGHPRWRFTPLEYAIGEGYDEIAERLRAAGG